MQRRHLNKNLSQRNNRAKHGEAHIDTKINFMNENKCTVHSREQPTTATHSMYNTISLDYKIFVQRLKKKLYLNSSHS